MKIWMAVCLGLVLSGAGYAHAQQSAEQVPPSPSSQTGQAAQQAQEREKEIEKKEHSQRALGIYPQFAVTSRQNAPPLSVGGKFHLFYVTAFDPFEFGLAGLQAGIDQAEDEFPAYGQGAEGFGKRFAADFGDTVSANFFSNFFWSVLLKEDPRYFRKGEGSFKGRLTYSLAQEFVCRTDRGHRMFNFQNVLGAVSSGALSNTYRPQADRGVALTARGAAFQLVYGGLGGLLSEFWPDVSARLHKHKKSQRTSESVPASPEATPPPKNP